jgi:multiple sugar transport system ATP-binding protein
MASIKLVDVSKTYPVGHVAVRSANLKVADGELVVLVGPSGSGKTTLLRVVAGLDQPTSGRIWIGERDVTSVPPQDRDIAMVFQNYALYPHKTVSENIAFGLRMHGASSVTIAERVRRVSQTLGLNPLLDRMPSQLSGGERQRVALGRAIAREPAAFLLDEPLSNLDAARRVEARAELVRLHRRLGATMLYVTHDQEEAMTLGDRVAVLHNGEIQQVGPPLEVYRRPANTFVAGFIGSPAMNLFRGTPRRRDAGLAVETAGFVFDLADVAKLPGDLPNQVVFGIRPEDIEVIDHSQADVTAEVDVVESLGDESHVHLVLASPAGEVRVTVALPARVAVPSEPRVGLRFARDRLHLFDAGQGNRLN